MYYSICEHCGASLDPCEHCDCKSNKEERVRQYLALFEGKEQMNIKECLQAKKINPLSLGGDRVY